VEARAPVCRPWWRINTLYSAILKHVLSKNLNQNMLKNAYFWKKSCKIAAASNPPVVPTLLLPSTDAASAGSFLVLNVSLLQKVEEVTKRKCSVFVSSALIRLYFTSSNSAVLLVGAQKDFLSPGAGTLATLQSVPPLHLSLPIEKKNKASVFWNKILPNN